MLQNDEEGPNEPLTNNQPKATIRDDIYNLLLLFGLYMI